LQTTAYREVFCQNGYAVYPARLPADVELSAAADADELDPDEADDHAEVEAA